VLPEGSSQELLSFLKQLDVPYEFFTPAADLDPAPTIYRKIARRWRKLKSENALVNHLLRHRSKNTIFHVDLSPQLSLWPLITLCRTTQVFYTAHNSSPKFPAWREQVWKLKFRVITRFRNFHIFTANVDARNYLQKLVEMKVADRIVVTPAGIDTEEIARVSSAPLDRVELLTRLGISKEKFIVLTVGQFIDRKGRWILLDAASKLLHEKDIIFLWLMPQLPDEPELRRIEGYGLGNSFRPVLSRSVGHQREDILSFIRLADIFVLPSLLEGLPISLLEAMSLGIPAVSTNVNAIPEAIRNEQTGILVPPGDPEVLASAILRLKTDDALRGKLSKEGRDFVTSNFDERKGASIALENYTCSLGIKIQVTPNALFAAQKTIN
jgi:glycosyltransferase involved in cell wall biosynthesis